VSIIGFDDDTVSLTAEKIRATEVTEAS